MTVAEGTITVVVEEAAWRGHRGLLPRLKAAAEAARRAAKLPAKSPKPARRSADGRRESA